MGGGSGRQLGYLLLHVYQPESRDMKNIPHQCIKWNETYWMEYFSSFQERLAMFFSGLLRTISQAIQAVMSTGPWIR